MKASLIKGINVIACSQIQFDGRLTAWSKCYDPESITPIYEEGDFESTISIEDSIDIVKLLQAVRHLLDEVTTAINEYITAASTPKEQKHGIIFIIVRLRAICGSRMCTLDDFGEIMRMICFCIHGSMKELLTYEWAPYK